MATTNHYDVIIIGTGAGGGTLARKLAPTGKKILLLERGDYVPREKDNWSPRAVNLEGKYQTKEIWHDKDGKDLHPHTNYYVGGNTKFFGAALFRLRKEDFGEIRHHGGISPERMMICANRELGVKTRHHGGKGSRVRVCFLILHFYFLIFNSRTFALQPLVKSVDAIGMTVADIDRSVEFFSKVLSFEIVSDVEVAGSEYEQLQGVFGLRMRVVRMKLGQELIELSEYLAPQGRPIPVDSRSNDRWFQHIAVVVSDMDRAYQQLRAHKVKYASTGPQTIPVSNQAAAGVRAFYFKDPDGHNLEIIYFPPGKGDPRWQNTNGKLFLGIDHTAIVVSDTARSLKFYRDLLGLRLAGESMNYGTEQEHLNNVANARLHISGLRAQSGPGIEFLEYLTPKDGRAAPADSRANDLWHWQTTLSTQNAMMASKTIRAAKRRFISPGVVEITEKEFGFAKGFLARDPDGHALQFVEK